MDRDAPDAKFARIAADLLKPPGRATGSAAFGERKRASEAIEAALQQRARRRSRRRRVIGAAAAATVLLVGGITFFAARRPPSIVVAIEGGGVLKSGRVVAAPARGEISLSVSTGSRLHLHGGGRLSLAELGQSQRFTLHAGRLWATVAPQAAGQRFVVATADTEVEVRGTSFEVAVVPPRPECEGTATEVRVFEGVVQVRRAGRLWRVGPGELWPGDCRSPPPAPSVLEPAAPYSAPTAPPTTPPAARPASTVRTVATAPPRPADSMPASTLAEQNNLFALAVAARRRGDLGEARRRLDDLLARFPSGALAESARSELARLPPPSPAGKRP
jgi:hypothetical protein